MVEKTLRCVSVLLPLFHRTWDHKILAHLGSFVLWDIETDSDSSSLPGILDSEQKQAATSKLSGDTLDSSDQMHK